MTSIAFPNLGIYLENVGKSFTVFGIEIAYYGCAIALGVIAGIMMAAYEAKRTGQNPDIYFDLALYAVVFSVIGGRLYYVIFSWDLYKKDWISIFNIRNGGLAIYGAVIGAVITVFIYAKIKKLSFRVLADTAVAGLVLGQIIGRWGNFFNREAFGDYTNNLFAMRLPLDAVRSVDVTEKMYEHLQVIDGISYIQVHPTFFYEMMWNVGVLIIILLRRKHKKFEGELFLTYLCGYGIGRFWIEGLRTDPLLIPGLDIPVSQVLAAVLAVLSAVLLFVGHKRVSSKQTKITE